MLKGRSVIGSSMEGLKPKSGPSAEKYLKSNLSNPGPVLKPSLIGPRKI
jgi:hypothetical protein